MEPETMWRLFCMTGEPLAYLFYRRNSHENSEELL